MKTRDEVLRQIALLWLQYVAEDEIGAALDPLNLENPMTCSVCNKTANESSGMFAASVTADCEWPTCNECIASIVDEIVGDLGGKTPPEER
jgi:hypothetical protein